MLKFSTRKIKLPYHLTVFLLFSFTLFLNLSIVHARNVIQFANESPSGTSICIEAEDGTITAPLEI
ncbi:MAG: hypothetical protein ACOC2F_01905, partial [Bacteroidota bacterium]